MRVQDARERSGNRAGKQHEREQPEHPRRLGQVFRIEPASRPRRQHRCGQHENGNENECCSEHRAHDRARQLAVHVLPLFRLRLVEDEDKDDGEKAEMHGVDDRFWQRERDPEGIEVA